MVCKTPVQSNIQGTSNREHRKRPHKARLHVQARPEITVDCFIGTGHPRFSVWNNSDTLAVNVQVINLEHNSMTMLFAPVPRVAKGQEELLEFHIEGAPMNAAHTLEGFVALLGKEAVSLPFVVQYENLDGHKFIANHRLDWSPPRIDLTFIPPLVQA